MKTAAGDVLRVRTESLTLFSTCPFSTAKPSNEAERLICSDKDLAALDVRVADLYKFGLTSVVDTNEFSGEQRGWLVQRDLCNDKPCLVTSYNDRIKDLQRWVRR
jgi:uncharacterized protein